MLLVTSGDLGGAALANIFKKVYLPSVDSLREIPAKMRRCALRSFGWRGGGGWAKKG